MCLRVWPLAASPDAPGHARRALRACPLSRQLEPLRADAELIISELVGNAVRHGGTEGLELRLSSDERELRVEVFDGGRGDPTVRAAAPEDENGRGLYLVQHLAEDFGVTQQSAGKVVWAVLRPVGVA